MNLGILFSVCDGPTGDEKHFDRFARELNRLGYPFAVHFDHCSDTTKEKFKSLRSYIGCHEDDKPDSLWDESFRQSAFNILVEARLDWALSLDVDETLEINAPSIIDGIVNQDADVVDCPVIDLWEVKDGLFTELKWRVDGPFQESHREKFFNLKHNNFEYYHPTSHAPRATPKGIGREPKVIKRYPLRVIHWGILNREDVEFHTERWNRIYTRKVGGNPYGFYEYINDQSIIPVLKEVPSGVFS